MRLSSSACEEGAAPGALQVRAEGKGCCWRVLCWAFLEASGIIIRNRNHFFWAALVCA